MATLPPPLSNLSLWQRTVRSHPLLSSNATTPLPESADTIVVGGGLMGALIAHHLLERHPHHKVVLLEARELASGASGRNAGHCRPDAARGFTTFAKLHGGEQARKIIESEAEVLKLMDDLVKTNGIECEWTRRMTYDACLSPKFTEYTEAAIAGLQFAGGTPDLIRLDDKEARKATGTNAETAFAWDAATVNPAQLTLGVHTVNGLTGRYEPFAWTPVVDCEPLEGGGGWVVVTERGSVSCNKVVWATNGYTAAVVPEFKGLVVPQRAQAHKLSRPPAGSTFTPLQGSYSLRKSMEEFYSVAPRPDGTIVLGASRALIPLNEYHNRANDAGFHAGLAANALTAFAEIYPEAGYRPPSLRALEADAHRAARLKPTDPLAALDAPWPAAADVQGEDRGVGFEYAWTGIIAATPDLVPFVGELPGKPGQYAAVGFNGHGMARIALCAPTLVGYMDSGEWEGIMPECFRITQERMARLRSAEV